MKYPKKNIKIQFNIKAVPTSLHEDTRYSLQAHYYQTFSLPICYSHVTHKLNLPKRSPIRHTHAENCI